MKILSSNINFRANRMSKPQARFINDTLKKSKQVDIICHESSDRDSVNSAMVMHDFLLRNSIQPRIILSQDVESLKLRNAGYNFVQASELEEEPQKSTTVFCVDFSAKDRVATNVLNYINKAKRVLGFDHHKEPDIKKGDYIHISAPLKENESIEAVSSFYIDSSAKSTTSVVYRFLETLNDDIDNSTAYDLFYGFVDDAIKRGLITCDGSLGKIKVKRELIEDKNAYEIYKKLKCKLTQEQIRQIAQNIDIMANLTAEENEFKNSLYENLRLSANKKIAYVEIPPNDLMWKKMGGDTTRTSTILNRFRQDVLNNKFNDENLKNVEAAFVFYEANGLYRLSAHTKTEKLLEFYEYVEKNAIPEFTQNSGGHSTRGGGRILTINPEKCHNWVESIISCEDFWQ